MEKDLAEKVIDVLRSEGICIETAKLTLQRAIRRLEFEPLAPKQEKSENESAV